MRQAKTELYVHAVWSTHRRARLLSEPVRNQLYPVMIAEAQKLGCIVMAVNGIEDHVHLCIRMPARLSVAELIKQIKGTSSRFLSQHFQFDEAFRWQAGYGAFSLSRSHVKRVVQYIEKQRKHHEQGTVWPEWEETDQETPE